MRSAVCSARVHLRVRVRRARWICVWHFACTVVPLWIFPEIRIKRTRQRLVIGVDSMYREYTSSVKPIYVYHVARVIIISSTRSMKRLSN